MAKTMKARVRLLAAFALAAATLGAGALASAPPGSATSSFTFTRLYGQDRFATAAAIAEAAFPNGASTAVVATGLDFPDALSGSYLAGVADAPILLVETHDPIPQPTLGALSALKVKNVVILGGPAAVGTDVAQTLSQTQSTSPAGGTLNVSRLYNQDGCTTTCNRYDTMEAVDTVAPSQVGTVNGQPTGILATGQNFPDALGAGPLAFAKHFPLILTDGSQSSLSPQAQAVISTDKITHLIVVGGPTAINPSQYNDLPGVSVDTTATSGKDRSQTSELLAEDEVANFGFTDTTFDVANGYDPSFTGQPPGFTSDALAGAPFGGLGEIPTLITLSPTDPGSASDFASKEASSLVNPGHAFGGTAALADSTLAAIAEAGGGSYPLTTTTYVVTPSTPQSVSNGSSVTYTATNLDSSPVDLALYEAGNVTRTSNGAYVFVSSGSVAQQGTVHAVITSVNGTAVSSPASSVDGVTPVNGSVTFTVESQAAESDDPVVYEQRSPADNNLVVNSSGQPTQPFGVGGTVTWGVPATTTTAPISMSTSEGPTGVSGSLSSGDTLTVVFNQSVEVSPTFELMLTDGTNVVQVNNQNATVALSKTNVSDDTVTFTLTANPSTTCTGCSGSEPSLTNLEVLSQQGVQNASGQQWDLPASAIYPGNGSYYCQASSCTRVFGGGDPAITTPPNPTVVAVTPPNTVQVTCPAVGDTINVYDLDGVLFGSTSCTSTGTVTITTTKSFGQGQPLLVTAEGPGGAKGAYESLATDPPLMMAAEGSAAGGYINVLWNQLVECPIQLTATSDFSYTPTGGSAMSPSSCSPVGTPTTTITLNFSFPPLSQGSGALSYSPAPQNAVPSVDNPNGVDALSQTIPVTVGP